MKRERERGKTGICFFMKKSFVAKTNFFEREKTIFSDNSKSLRQKFWLKSAFSDFLRFTLNIFQTKDDWFSISNVNLTNESRTDAAGYSNSNLLNCGLFFNFSNYQNCDLVVDVVRLKDSISVTFLYDKQIPVSFLLIKEMQSHKKNKIIIWLRQLDRFESRI